MVEEKAMVEPDQSDSDDCQKDETNEMDDTSTSKLEEANEKHEDNNKEQKDEPSLGDEQMDSSMDISSAWERDDNNKYLASATGSRSSGFLSWFMKQEPTRDATDGYNPTVHRPDYEPILMTGDDDDEDAQPRRMMGYAAYHGTRFLPAEVKDNIEHFRANTVTAAPRLSVPRPKMAYPGWD